MKATKSRPGLYSGLRIGRFVFRVDLSCSFDKCLPLLTSAVRRILDLDPMTIPRIVRVGTIGPLADNAMKLELAGYPINTHINSCWARLSLPGLASNTCNHVLTFSIHNSDS